MLCTRAVGETRYYLREDQFHLAAQYFPDTIQSFARACPKVRRSVRRCITQCNYFKRFGERSMRRREQERRKGGREGYPSEVVRAGEYLRTIKWHQYARRIARVRARARGLTHPRRINSVPTCTATEATCPEASPGLLSAVVYTIKSSTAEKKS